MQSKHLIEAYAALRDAAKRISELEEMNDDLLQAIGRARDDGLSGPRHPYLEQSRTSRAIELVVNACVAVGADYEHITEKTAGGHLKRGGDRVRKRLAVVWMLRRDNATPTGPVAHEEIACGMGIASHATIIELEQRARRMVKEWEDAA